MSKFDLDGFLPYQLAVLSARVSRRFSVLYRRKFGISVAEWRVVAHLSQAGSVSVREIYERVDLDKPKVSRAASRLEAAGYVLKLAHPEDGRLVALSLTGKGHAMIAELAPVARAFEQEILAQLGAQAGPFRASLGQLLNGLKQAD